MRVGVYAHVYLKYSTRKDSRLRSWRDELKKKKSPTSGETSRKVEALYFSELNSNCNGAPAINGHFESLFL